MSRGIGDQRKHICKIWNNELIILTEKNNFYYIYACAFMCNESIQIVSIKP